MEREENEKVYLNTGQLAKRWLVCEETARRYLRANELPSIIIKRHRLVLLEDIIRYEQAAQVGRASATGNKNCNQLVTL